MGTYIYIYIYYMNVYSIQWEYNRDMTRGFTSNQLGHGGFTQRKWGLFHQPFFIVI